MKKSQRTRIHSMLLGVVLPLWLLSFVFGRSSAALVDTAQSQTLAKDKESARQSAERREEMELNVGKLLRPRLGSSKADPFATYMPKPIAPVLPPAPPPAPTAPALPFTYLGRMVENDSAVLFLSKQDQSYSVRENGVLDKNYRIDKIDSNQAVFTYLPLNIQQTLTFGRAG